MRSQEIFERACKVIPGGVNSPVRAFGSVGGSPMIVDSGRGDVIVDVDGRKFIDFCGSWGPLILGHAHEAVLKGVVEQLEKGFSFGISTEIEERFAAKIVELIPSIEKIRFVSSGTEATMTALRIARGATGRSKIVKFTGHYHGHSDSLLVQAGSGVAFLNPMASSKGVNAAVVADTICLSFNDFDAVRNVLNGPMRDQIAAVILEPIAGNMGVVPPAMGYLQMLREETNAAGALLIFDEVITGFRVGLGGAQGLYGIDPDLTCFGKVIGGGFPVAAVGGKAKLMDRLAPLGQVYQAGTLSGNPVAMRAGLETLKIVEKKGFYEELERKSEKFARSLEKGLKGRGCIQRVGSMFTIFLGVEGICSSEDVKRLDGQLYGRFFRYLFEKGIFIPPAMQEAWFISAAHTEEHLDYTSNCICDFVAY